MTNPNTHTSASTKPDPAVHAWLVLWKAYDTLHAHAMRSIAELDMCVSDFGILELLLHKGPNTINAIGDTLSLASGSITAAIDRLENRSLVERTASPTDRRAKVVRLTTKGRHLIERSFDEHSRHMKHACDGLTRAEQAQLIDLLKKLGISAAAKLKQ